MHFKNVYMQLVRGLKDFMGSIIGLLDAVALPKHTIRRIHKWSHSIPIHHIHISTFSNQICYNSSVSKLAG